MSCCSWSIVFLIVVRGLVLIVVLFCGMRVFKELVVSIVCSACTSVYVVV